MAEQLDSGMATRRWRTQATNPKRNKERQLQRSEAEEENKTLDSPTDLLLAEKNIDKQIAVNNAPSP
jgi:transposase-like protein